MIRQFVRLWLTVMIPVMLLVGLAHHYGTQATARAAYVEGLRVGLQTSFASTRQQIGALKIDDWASSLPKLRAAYAADLRFDLVPVASAKLRSSRLEASRFEQGDVAFAIGRRGATHAYQRIPGTPLTIGSDLVIPIDDDISPTLYVILAVATVSMLVMWLWFHPSWLALERLGKLTEDGSSPGRQRVASDRGDRTSFLFASAIDRVATRLTDLLQTQRTRNNSVAHELTAPISQLSFALELLRERPDSPDAPRLLAGMREDLQVLDDLVSESLEQARLGSWKPDLVETSLSELMRGAVAAAGKLPRHDRQILSIDLPGERDRVRCDRRQMGRAVFNLIRNAVRHADAMIVVHAEVEGATTWIHVDDDGPGIPEPLRASLFAPFARGDAEADAPTSGWGLGLAIVQQIATMHGGRTRIEESPFGGARVSIGW